MTHPQGYTPTHGPDEPTAPSPRRSPDAADLALAKIITPWLDRHHIGGNKQLAQALAAWLTARGIY